MRRTFLSLLAAMALVLGMSPAAEAALPKADTTYKGVVTEPSGATGSIVIKSKTRQKLRLVKYTNSCGEVQKVRNVAVKNDGSFKAQIKLENFGGVVVFEVKGKFKTARKAKGTITEAACSGAKSSFVAKKK